MQFFTVSFICNYQMTDFPFDTQECSAIIQPDIVDQLFVKLIPRNLTYVGPLDLSKYVLNGLHFIDSEKVRESEKETRHKNNLLFQGIEVKLVLEREVISEALITILPTFLIVLVCFTSSFYGLEHFDAMVAVNVTAFLVIATLFISVSNSLPRSSSIKMIDGWMIFTMFVPLAEVILQTMISKIPPEKNQAWVEARPPGGGRKKQALQIMALYGLPAIFSIFLAAFFLYGLFGL